MSAVWLNLAQGLDALILEAAHDGGAAVLAVAVAGLLMVAGWLAWRALTAPARRARAARQQLAAMLTVYNMSGHIERTGSGRGIARAFYPREAHLRRRLG